MRSWLIPPVLALRCAIALGADCDDCVPPRQCPIHALAEAEAIQAAKAGLRSSDVAARCAALQRLADATRDHANAPGRDLARCLAGALADRSLKVRETAASLLPGQDSDEAIKALVKAAATASELLREPQFREPDDAGASPVTYATSVFNALGQHRDDRAVDALVEALHHLPPDQQFMPHARALMELLARLGSRQAIDPVLEVIRRHEGPGTSRSLHEILVRAAAAKQLTDVPEWQGPGTAKAWEKWLTQHKQEFPARLGKLAR